MEYLSVKNWDKLQHYKDRNPSWIKLYTVLLDDDDFESLPDNSKLHLVLLWLLAARRGNKLPNDEAKLTKKLPIYGQVSLQPLIDGGWLVPYDSKMVRSCYNREEKRREEKTLFSKPKKCHRTGCMKMGTTYDHDDTGLIYWMCDDHKKKGAKV
ncbi:MAG: hypothetical protein HWN69_07080 [Desulfobacterales bacterium]|nr:hypothetical protein [Desulfobacterales bacterium]